MTSVFKGAVVLHVVLRRDPSGQACLSSLTMQAQRASRAARI